MEYALIAEHHRKIVECQRRLDLLEAEYTKVDSLIAEMVAKASCEAPCWIGTVKQVAEIEERHPSQTGFPRLLQVSERRVEASCSRGGDDSLDVSQHPALEELALTHATTQ